MSERRQIPAAMRARGLARIAYRLANKVPLAPHVAQAREEMIAKLREQKRKR